MRPEIKSCQEKSSRADLWFLIQARFLAVGGQQKTKWLRESTSNSMLKKERIRSQTSNGIVKLEPV